MMRRCRMAALSITVLACFGSAQAGPLEDAQALFDRKDWSGAMKVVLPLAESGDPRAQVLAGHISRRMGDDNVAAVGWFTKSAEQGHPDGQFQLGYMYEMKGLPGVTQDLPKALEWFRVAAKNGSSDAMLAIAGRHASGVGFERDSFRALEWVRKAADRGNTGAYFKLGEWYNSVAAPSKEGVPVKGDKVEAYKWYWLTANSPAHWRWEQPIKMAQGFLSKMEGGLSPEQVKQAVDEANKHLKKVGKRK